MKILLVSTAWPWPTRKGYQLRLLQLANGLARWHEVTLLVPASAGPGEPGALQGSAFAIETFRLSRFAALPGVGAAFFGGRSLESGLVASPDLRRRLRELAPRFDRVVLQLVRLAGVTDSLAGTPWVLDLVDSLSLNLERRAALDRFWMRPLLRFEARRLAADERRMIAASAVALLVSERDRRHLAAALPAGLAARLEVVPLALPTWRESALPVGPPTAAARAHPTPPAGECAFAITGNLGYFPTVRGIAWFLDQVWPELRARHGDRLHFRIVGRAMPEAFRRRHGHDGIDIVADAPDVAPHYAAATLAIAPLFSGRGTRLKLIEAAAYAVPVVATSSASAGLPFSDPQSLWIAEDKDTFVAAVSAALASPAERSRRARHALDLARRRHDRELVVSVLAQRLSLLLESRKDRGLHP